MNKSMLKAATCLTALSVATGSFAGGMDRATFSPDILFTEGNRLELSYGTTSPSVAPELPSGASFNVAPSFDTIKGELKTDISDRFAVALMVNSNPFGVRIDYAPAIAGAGENPLLGAVAGLNADLNSNSIAAIAKYSFSDNISVYGGLRHTKTTGEANLVGSPATLNVKGSGVDVIVGAAYERREIALRAALTYEAGTELDPEVTASPGGPIGIGQINVPEAITLSFQTGVAANTLVFANIRHAKWEDAQVLLPDGTPLSSFENSTNFTLGVGRQINDNFAVRASLNYEASGAEPVSLLSPTNGIRGIGLGGRYTSDNGVETSLGVSYSKRGDAAAGADGLPATIPFAGNSVLSVGLKVSMPF